MSGDIVFGIRLKGDAKNLVGEVKVSREEFRKLAAEAKHAGESVGGGFTNAAKGVRSISGQLEQMRGLMRGIGAGSGVYLLYQQFKQTAGAILEAQANADRLKNSLAFATGSQRGAAQDIAYLRKLTSELGLEFGSASAAYAKLAASAQGTAVSSRQVKDIFEAVAKASTVMGLSSEETSGALLAISQMMSKGTVSAEELRGQLGERIPGALNIAARAMGKTTGELGKMLEQGQILAADFLPKFAAELTRTLGDAPEKAAASTQAAMNRMSGAWQQAKQAFAASGPGNALVSMLDGAANAMQRFADGVAAAKRSGWSGWSSFFYGIGNAELGDTGFTNDIDKRKEQLVRRIFEIQDARKRMLETEDAYTQNMMIPGLDKEEAGAKAELDRLSRRGKIRVDLAKDFAEQEAQTKVRRNEMLKQLDEDLAKFDENLGKRQQLDALKQKYGDLQRSDPAKYNQLMAAARQKLYGKQDQAAQLEALDAEQGVARQKLKAHLDELAMLQKTGQISQIEEIRQGAQARLDELDREIALEQQKKAVAARDPSEGARADGRIRELQAEKDTVSRQAANDAIELRRAQTLALDQWRQSEADALEQMEFEASLIGKSREEIERLTNARRIDLTVRRATRNADGSRKVEADVEAQYQAEAEAAKKAYEEKLAARTRYEESWVAGAKRALASYMDEIRNWASGAGRLFEVTARGAEDAWVKFFTTGKIELREWGDAIAQEIARIIYQRNIANTAASLIDMGISALGGWLGGGAPAGGGGGGGGGMTAGPGQVYAAKGAWFDGNVAAFARGGVVDRPTNFRFAQGGSFRNGLMGEAGPEAIMPLRRDSSGNLGVMSAGAGGGNHVEINIIEGPGTKATVSQREQGGKLTLDVMIEQIEGGIARNVARGRGPLSGAMERTYGLGRAPGALV